MSKHYKAGVIGRTGAGDYGHGLETVYRDLEQVDLVALADPDPEGRAAAGERTGAQRLYADYRQMLADEDLDIVSVCPRMPDCHADMVIACAEAGVRGVFIEKPLTPHACARPTPCWRPVRSTTSKPQWRTGAPIPTSSTAKKLVDEGVIGQLQVLRSHGKSDRRAGSQDLMVLGTHMMDSMRYFAGAEVVWAHGHVTQDGREVTLDDVREGDERIGLIAGNGVAAYYVFANGVTAHFESQPGYPKGFNSRWFGFEAHGSEGIIALRNSPNGEMYIYRQGLWIPGEENGTWERVLLDEWEQYSAGERTHQSNLIIVRELIQAIEEDRPVRACSNGEDGRAALEMIMAVHESQRLGTRVSLPLANRENPYEIWRREGGER